MSHCEQEVEGVLYATEEEAWQAIEDFPECARPYVKPWPCTPIVAGDDGQAVEVLVGYVIISTLN
jgi:hypothetical protein